MKYKVELTSGKTFEIEEGISKVEFNDKMIALFDKSEMLICCIPIDSVVTTCLKAEEKKEGMTKKIAFSHIAQWLSVHSREPKHDAILMGFDDVPWTYNDLKEFLLK